MSNIQNMSIVYTVDICANRYTSGFLDGLYVSFLLGLAACIYMFMQNMKTNEEPAPIVINVYTNKDEEDCDCDCEYDEEDDDDYDDDDEDEDEDDDEDDDEEEQSDKQQSNDSQEMVEKTTQTNDKTTTTE
jgi:phosphopantothenoylcysteine synthetase/decarboxylase